MKFEDTKTQVQNYLSKQVPINNSRVVEMLTDDIADYLELIWSSYYFETDDFEKLINCNMRKFSTLLQDFNEYQAIMRLRDSLYSFALNYFRELEAGIEAFKKVYPKNRVESLRLKNNKLIVVTDISSTFNTLSFVVVDDNLNVSKPLPTLADALD